MAWIQGAVSADGSGTSQSVTLSNPIGSGNTIVGFITTASGPSSVTITDDKANTYTVLLNNEFILFALTGITGGPTTITASWGSTSISTIQVIVDEYSNISAVSGHNYTTNSSPGAGTDGISSGSVTTPEADVVWGAIGCYGGHLATTGTGFTQRTTTGASGNDMVSEDLTQGSAGAVSATFTAPSGGGSSQYYCGVITLTPSGGTIITASLSESASAADAIGPTMTAMVSLAEAVTAIDQFTAALAQLTAAYQYAIFQSEDLTDAIKFLAQAQSILTLALKTGDMSQLPQLQQQVLNWKQKIAMLKLAQMQSRGVSSEASRQLMRFALPERPDDR